MGRVLVGTASWTDRSLLESGWYPPTATTPEERLDHYAANFPLVEVGATYYHPPALRTAELWRDRTPDDFTFNIKATSSSLFWGWGRLREQDAETMATPQQDPNLDHKT